MKRILLCVLTLLMLASSTVVLSAGQWRTYTLIFMSEGEEFATVEAESIDELKITDAYPTKEGCAFAGWYLDDGVFEKAYPDEYAGWAEAAKKWNGERTLTLYARFVEAPLVPRMMEKSSFDELTANLKKTMPTHDYNRFTAFYNDYTSSNELHKANFPILQKRNTTIYLLDPKATEIQIRMLESWITTYCPEYTYEDLARHHAEVEYDGYLYP